ncbi:MAG: hypothetical protein WBC44_01165 [Planctomycetaceae bacterium]
MTNRHIPDSADRRHFPQILRWLSFSAAVLVAAQAGYGQEQSSDPAGGQSEATSGNPEASVLLRQSRDNLSGYRTLKAKMVETAEFGPRRFKAEGVYLQGVDHRVRVDVDVSIGENKGRLLQVSDGEVLWTIYDVGPKLRITRRDVNQILAATDGAQAKATELAELGLGGLPALLASIERSNDFQPTQTATIEGRKFYVLQGVWKPEVRQQFQAKAQLLPAPTTEPRPLPPHVPDLIRVYLDSETLFPYRIRYLKQIEAAPGAEPAPILTLDFRDIVVNASLDPSEFRYTPPAEAEVADITSFYLQKIKDTAGNAPASSTGNAPQ